IDGLEQHWERARVDADLARDHVEVKTKNVTSLTLSMVPGYCNFNNTHKVKVLLDGKELEAPTPGSDRSWIAHFRKVGNSWSPVPSRDEEGPQKRHGLQGPIDDAFMDSFLMVRPTGEPRNKEVHGWVDKEMAHAIDHWRKQFRGDARVRDDSSITDADIAAH